MIIFKKRAEKHRVKMKQLQEECDYKNSRAQWENTNPDASNRYHLYYIEYEVSHKSTNSIKPGEYGWAVREKHLFDPSKCSITDIKCGWGGDCRECQEPITHKLITFK
jgi:hypothetical protein